MSLFRIAINFLLLGLILGLGFLLLRRLLPWATPIDTYRGVAIYDNGPNFVKSHGRHFDWSGYYYGQKWQCVEFIKRFYFQALHHRMPEVMGHATDFFDPNIPSGEINVARGLRQFRNGGLIPPQPDDIIVFGELTHYGHIAIVTNVTPTSVEMIQQNFSTGPRSSLPLNRNEGAYWVGNEQLLATGWLRLPN